jgi:hypothetical protein
MIWPGVLHSPFGRGECVAGSHSCWLRRHLCPLSWELFSPLDDLASCVCGVAAAGEARHAGVVIARLLVVSDLGLDVCVHSSQLVGGREYLGSGNW